MAHVAHSSNARTEFFPTEIFTAAWSRLVAWRRYRKTVSLLSALSDTELADIGVSRSEIHSAARNGR